MGKKRKLEKFARLEEFPLVFQQVHWESALVRKEGEEMNMQGKWGEYFGNDLPIILELACGYGEYTIGMSAANKDANYIGVDIKGDRIHQGAAIAIEEGRENAAFLRASISNLDRFFAPEEVSEIWIIFPDPFLPERQSKKRLTAPPFLHIYHRILKPQAFIHLKTDSDELFEFSHLMMKKQNCTVVENNNNIYKNGFEEEFLKIKTRFEKSHLADDRTIKYLKFQLPEVLPPLPVKKKRTEASEEEED